MEAAGMAPHVGLAAKATQVVHAAMSEAERVLTEITADLKPEDLVPGLSGLTAAASRAEQLLFDFKPDLSGDFLPHIRTSFPSPSLPGDQLPKLAPLPVDAKAELPWVAKNEHERKHEKKFRERIMQIAKNPDEYLTKHVDEALIVDMKKAMQSAGAVLQVDEELRRLRFDLVPKKMREQEFWRRYFIAVKRIKQEILAAPDDEAEAGTAGEDALDPTDEDAYRSAFQAMAVPPSMVVRRLAMAMGVAKAVPSIRMLAEIDKAELDAMQATAHDVSWSNLMRSMETGLATLAAKATGKAPRSPKKQTSMQGPGVCHALLWSLFDAGTSVGELAERHARCGVDRTLPEEIHGSPPHGFLAQLAEIMGGVKTEQTMARFWIEVVQELRKRWVAGEPIPHMSPDAEPGLQYSIIHQKLQLLNACMARRKRRAAGIKALEAGSIVPPHALPRRRSSLDVDTPENPAGGPPETPDNADEFENKILVVRLAEGGEARRLGVALVVPGLRMLETGEAVYAPATQEGPVLTEDLIRETEELILRTGSVGAGCSQLFADMQAFKAANPGCILEDFVRWYSPLDWVEDGSEDHSQDSPREPCSDPPEEQVVNRWSGALSGRMQTNGNLWRELWASARPIPSVKQAPLFDEELAGEGALDWLLDITPLDLFEQLFTAVLGAGFAIAEAAPQSKVEPLRGCVQECRTYVALACTPGMTAAKLERLCQVYEIMEVSVHTPPEELTPRRHQVPKYGSGKDAHEREEEANRLSTQFVQVTTIEESNKEGLVEVSNGGSGSEERRSSTGGEGEGGVIYDGVSIEEAVVDSLTARLASLSTNEGCESAGVSAPHADRGLGLAKEEDLSSKAATGKEGREQKDVNGFLIVSPGVPIVGTSPPEGDWTLV